MSQLKVYKASAGSGKTFRLAIEYMKLALTNDTNYRHILAVTFTNKATAEMKSRIIGELFRLSKGEQTAYLEILSKELSWPVMQVQRQSQLVLKRILHDYSRFSISTIDSFFQRVIKAFNRELGINAAYNVELDEGSILEEAVDLFAAIRVLLGEARQCVLPRLLDVFVALLRGQEDDVGVAFRLLFP